MCKNGSQKSGFDCDMNYFPAEIENMLRKLRLNFSKTTYFSISESSRQMNFLADQLSSSQGDIVLHVRIPREVMSIVAHHLSYSSTMKTFALLCFVWRVFAPLEKLSEQLGPYL